MSDLTVYAENLIATVARAFYDDECVCLVDVLLRDKFLRDDDMAPRLNLPARRLRAALQFLTEEHLVSSETVDDLAQGGSQATKFYYIDYNRAVHSIRLRLHLLRQQLEQAELRARSSSFYLCPGYKIKRCNGRYTEEEAQQVVDTTTGLFLCQECARLFANDPDAPPLSAYTLQLVDNTRELKTAMDHVRRLQVQMSAKFIGNFQMRAGVYDLVQKVRSSNRAATAITSNLPSENMSLGIGSKRLAGTGRTAGIKAKKLELQGVAESAQQARDYLVGGGSGSARLNGMDDGDLMFLKNALGQEVQFALERGGGARAQLLATARRRKRKLMDAAASRAGALLPLPLRMELERRRKLQALEEQERQKKNKSKSFKTTETWDFLQDSIGPSHKVSQEYLEEDDDSEAVDDQYDTDPGLIMDDELEELQGIPDDNRIATFQAQYKAEMDRQLKVLDIPVRSDGGGGGSPGRNFYPSPSDDDERSLAWEDGDFY